MANFNRGDQIIYVPTHAEGDTAHPDCEIGFVTSQKGNTVYCRYWRRRDVNPLENDLRTKMCSEGCDSEMLRPFVYAPQDVIERMLEAYCQEVPHVI